MPFIANYNLNCRKGWQLDSINNVSITYWLNRCTDTVVPYFLSQATQLLRKKKEFSRSMWIAFISHIDRCLRFVTTGFVHGNKKTLGSQLWKMPLSWGMKLSLWLVKVWNKSSRIGILFSLRTSLQRRHWFQ